MKVVSVEVLVVGDPPGGPPDGRLDAIAVVRVRTADGATGLAEAFGVPPAVAVAALDGPASVLGGRVVGTEVRDPRETWSRLYDGLLFSHRRGWSIGCLGALDVALWDAFGREAGEPVHRLLGTSARDPYQAGAAFERDGLTAYATVYTHERDHGTLVRRHLERVEQALALGYDVLKLEPMQSTRTTIEGLTRQCRALAGPDVALAVDVGYHYTDWWTALRTIERLAELDVEFFETPLPVDVLGGYRELATRSPIALAAGEHASTRWDVQALIDHGVTVVQPYTTAVGGLSEMVRITALAEAAGVRVVPGNWSTALLGAANVHAAAVSRVTPMIESAPPELYASPLRIAFQEHGLPVRAGRIGLPTAPGLGVDVPDRVLEAFRR